MEKLRKWDLLEREEKIEKFSFSKIGKYGRC